MLVRLLYTSRATDNAEPGSDSDTLHDIMQQARSGNPKQGITGILCHSHGLYMQVLEGGRDAINVLYAKILRDPRHTDVILLNYEEINERHYALWTMGLAKLDKVNPAILLRFSELAELNPHAMSGKNALALINDLMAAATNVRHS